MLKRNPYRDTYDLWQGEAAVLLDACTVPACVRQWIAQETASTTHDELEKLGEDVFYGSEEICWHEDSNIAGTITMGLVLRNDLRLYLATEGQVFPLREGSVYRINGHTTHAAPQEIGGTEGRFAALIWDVPRDLERPPVDFAAEAVSELRSRFETS